MRAGETIEVTWPWALASVLALVGWGLAMGMLIDEDPEPAHGRVELVCHPVEGDTTGARVCVTP